jgi:multidrug resistance efflux pump
MERLLEQLVIARKELANAKYNEQQAQANYDKALAFYTEKQTEGTDKETI